jgi:hypothetical protein
MLTRKLALLLAVALVALAAVSSASARVSADAPAADDEVILPSRVANALDRLNAAVSKAAEHVDEEEYAKAIVSLRSVRRNVFMADKAAKRQMNAAPADPEAETTPGPDSVVAVLNAEQAAIERAAGLFNGQSGAVVTALSSTLVYVQGYRDRLVNAVVALPAEGAGADFSDGMADTVDGYADEVANLTEALADDNLSAGGKSSLTAALNRSKATAAKINTAFGGGE